MTAGDSFRAWVGRERTQNGRLSKSDIDRLAAVFDRTINSDIAPPAWHWACMTEDALQSKIGDDGHPKRGNFLPPVKAALRMFAGATITFSAELRLEVDTVLHERIVSIIEKPSRHGPLIFIDVERSFHQNGSLCVREVQSIVYRDRTVGEPARPILDGAKDNADWRVEVRPDPVLLFRFSAATFNSHRIHYDRPYAIDVEGYPALVVHGPLIALSLLEAFYSANPGVHLSTFQFRARSPVFDNAPFFLCGARTTGAARLWAERSDGALAMTADVHFAKS